MRREARKGLKDLFSMQGEDPEFLRGLREEIGDQEPDVCFQCMRCTSGCDAFKFQKGYKPHQLVGFARLGLKERMVGSEVIWNCTTCSYCKEVCPQRVAPVDVVKAARRMAVREGRAVEDHRKIAGYLIKTGHLVPVNDTVRGLREKLGLPGTPPTTHASQKALEEVRELVKRTGFVKLLGEGKDG
ncbi:MAG: 4Fe-4S dicluster domain-containing protein [Candidatus Hadarchaeales archaeon]